MAYVWEVTKALSLLTDIAEEEKETSETICRHCFEEIINLLRADIDQADPRIVAAAAGRAFYNLCIKRAWVKEEDNLSSFKAGDLSISYDSSNNQDQLTYAKEIRDKAMLELTPLLADNGFYCGKVEIYDRN